MLRPLVTKRNQLFRRWLHTQLPGDRERFVNQRRHVAKMVREAKNNWYQQQAQLVECGVADGGSMHAVWRSLRNIQRGRAGLQPVRPKSVRRIDVQLCCGPVETLERWREHFRSVLNVSSVFCDTTIDLMPVLPLRESMGSPPSSEEIWEALSCINAGRAAGKNSLILPELLKCCEADLLEYIHDLFVAVWEEGKVPEEWRDALLVPVPKKGDLTQCDNWRGISLLNTMGKLFGKVLQRRLQEMAEGVLSDSQCGFHSGRGCVDLIFSARQLLEKTIEHQSKLFMLLVDLRKAYDSVPRCALWKILEQYGVPEVMIGLLRSLYDGMEAEVTIGGCTSATFSVTNGLRQGCTIAPTLFALYLNRVIECWWDVVSLWV